jgi:phosphohistidine phosphatase
VRLLLARHGQTEWNADRRFQGHTDVSLSPRGRAQAHALGRALRGRPVTAAYVSPMKRAVETAEILAPLLASQGEMIVDPYLAEPPDVPLLRGLEGERVAAVGHEPWMSELTSWLVTGSRGRGSGFAFKKGGVAWLSGELRPGHVALVAFLPPRVTKKL